MAVSLRGLHALVLSSLVTGVAGCGTMRGSSSSTVENERIRALEVELRRRQVEVQDLKERNLVLERRLRNVSAPSVAPTESLAPTPQAPSASPAPLVIATPPSAVSAPEPTGDQLLYSKILQTYRKRNLSEMEKSLGLLMKTYPESVYADNALYLGGQLAYELGNFALAREYMDRVLRVYPKGNKAVGAMFAQAMMEKKLARPQEAKRILESLRTLFPGSPEAMRVATELKLIEMATTQKRGM